MTDTEIKETLERTRCAMARHLGDLMDEIDQADGRISSRKLLGGIHEAVDTMSKLGTLSDTGEKVAKAAPSQVVDKVR
jgi:hypothetical protein